MKYENLELIDIKIVFISNYFNHHQKPFCEEMYRILGNDFSFISTSMMSDERVKLGYVANDLPVYVYLAYENTQTRRNAMRLIEQADAVIVGEAPEEFLVERLCKGKLVFRYTERPFKKGPSILRKLYHAVNFRRRDQWSRNVYVLCASAYAAADFSSLGMYNQRMYKWGYFPEVKQYDVNKLLDEKKRNTLLWCGRFIDWKHPDDAIRLAGKLKDHDCTFHLNMIGTGDMESELKRLAEECNVADRVHFLGSMSPDKVRAYMEEAGVYLFTSDRQEGWGAVLNEAMASACAVIASDAAGATPFLIHDGENGMVYHSGNTDMLFEHAYRLLCQPTMQLQYGNMAYKTILDTWNGKVAAGRLLQLIEKILQQKEFVHVFEEGPCSQAEVK